MKLDLRRTMTGRHVVILSWFPFLILLWLAPSAWATVVLRSVGTPTNPIFGTSRIEIKIVIFIVLYALAYMMGYLLFQKDLGKRRNPIQATASSFVIVALLIFVSAFFCFSEHTFRPGANVQGSTSFGMDYLSQINPLPWIFVVVILTALVVINHLASRQESS